MHPDGKWTAVLQRLYYLVAGLYYTYGIVTLINLTRPDADGRSLLLDVVEAAMRLRHPMITGTRANEIQLAQDRGDFDAAWARLIVALAAQRKAHDGGGE